MRGSQLIKKAVDLLRPQYPDLTVKAIKESLSVNQVEGDGDNKTKIFEATYIDNDPIKTQKVLKAIQQVYQDYNREQQKLRLSKGLAFINNQLPNVRKSVQESEAALEGFRKSQNLIEPDAQAKALSDSLNTCSAGATDEPSSVLGVTGSLQHSTAANCNFSTECSGCLTSESIYSLPRVAQRNPKDRIGDRGATQALHRWQPSYSKATLAAQPAACSIAGGGSTCFGRRFGSNEQYGRGPSDKRTVRRD
jgi:hypothetical protein